MWKSYFEGIFQGPRNYRAVFMVDRNVMSALAKTIFIRITHCSYKHYTTRSLWPVFKVARY